VMFVIAFAVVGGLRVTTTSQPVREGGVNGVLPAPVRPALVPAAGTRKPARARIAEHPRAHVSTPHELVVMHAAPKRVAHVATPARSSSTRRPSVSAPVHAPTPKPAVVPPRPPVVNPPSGGSTSTAAPFVLTGSLKTVGAPALVDQQTLAPTADGASALFSRFVADTTAGELSVKQTVQQTVAAADDGNALNIHVKLPIAGQSVVTAPVSSSSSTTVLPSGQLSITQHIDVVPVTPAATVVPLAPTSVDIQMMVSADGQGVTSETVNVQNVPTTLPPGSVVGTAAPAAPTSPVASPAGGVGAVVSNDSAKGVIEDFAVVGRPENDSGVN